MMADPSKTNKSACSSFLSSFYNLSCVCISVLSFGAFYRAANAKSVITQQRHR